MQTSSTDCRTDVGVTVGAIDAIITLCHLLQGRDMAASEVQEALKDLGHDEDFRCLCEHAHRISMCILPVCAATGDTHL